MLECGTGHTLPLLPTRRLVLRLGAGSLTPMHPLLVPSYYCMKFQQQQQQTQIVVVMVVRLQLRLGCDGVGDGSSSSSSNSSNSSSGMQRKISH
eukprot:COSAG01_NODE_2610_length_7384_cov_12.240906_2_plen_94_part_00